MQQHRLNAFNKADALVLTLFLAFLVVLYLHLRYPAASLYKVAYFTLEAALVGGIADWFAVTALFKRPLGISFHTNLLLQNKEKLAKGCGVLVQEELLSKAGLEAKLEATRFTDAVLAKLEQPEVKAKLEGLLLDYVEGRLRKIDTDLVAGKLEEAAKTYVNQWNLPELARQFVKGRLDAGYGEVLYQVLIKRLAQYVAEPETKAVIYRLVEEKVEAYKAEHQMASFFSSLADSLFGGLFGAKKILDAEEMAAGIYLELQNTVQRLDEYAPLRTWFLGELNNAVYAVANSKEWQMTLLELQCNTAERVNLKQPLKIMLDKMLGELCRAPGTVSEKLVVPTLLARTIDSGFNIILTCLRDNTTYREQLEELLGKLARVCFTHVHSLLGQMVEIILNKMDDQDLNELIYSKVEEDMLWIRYNGSLIGGILGCIYGLVTL